jgi:hypothetical protein
MSHAGQNTLGLDVGTSRIVIARRAEDDFRYESQLNAFVAIPYSKITEGVLEREKIPHTVQAGQIIVHGNESEKFAGLLNAETRRPMTGGVLDAKEPDSLSMIREILTTMFAGYRTEKRQKVCFTVPASPLGAEGSLTYHEATLRQILTDLNYQPVSINEGLAIVYSEMESSNYTGIGISCGGGLCNVCLAYLSVPVFSFSIPKGGDFIDSSVAEVRGEPATRIRTIKEESFHFNGHFANKIYDSLAVFYEDMMQALVAALKDTFASVQNMPKLNRPIPLVLSGGSAMAPGFRDRFEKIMRDTELPVAISEVRLAPSPMHSTARGALVAALSDM